MKRLILIATCAWLIASAPALAQYNAPAAARAAGKPTTPDSAFVAAAAQSSFYAAAVGRLAESRASSAEVKRIATDMIAMAERMSTDVAPLLKAQGVAAPGEMDQRQKSAFDWLQKLEGEAFDRAFVSSMRATRASEVMVFQRAAEKAHVSELRTWAAAMLPMLKAQQDRFNGMK
jgi:putative membrane protein